MIEFSKEKSSRVYMVIWISYLNVYNFYETFQLSGGKNQSQKYFVEGLLKDVIRFTMGDKEF